MKKLFLLVSCLCLTLSVSAGIPALTGRVVDNANLLDAKTRKEITGKLESLEEQTGIQLAVLTVNSLEGKTIEDFSISVAESWKLGQKDKDNGILVTVALHDRAMRIEVGYGLNPVLTAAKCDRIIRNLMTPQFRENNYSKGISDAVDAIIAYTCGDEKAVSEMEKKQKKSDWLAQIIPTAMVLFFVIIVVTNEAGVGPFGMLFFMSLLSGKPFHRQRPVRRHSGHFDDDDFFSGGHGGFGGGGGFSGGGGSFGGGGSSGRW